MSWTRGDNGSGRPVRVLAAHVSSGQGCGSLASEPLQHSGSCGPAVNQAKLAPLQPKRSTNNVLLPPFGSQLKNKFMKKIPRDAEASNVLVGEVDFLSKPFVAFVRLAQATTLGGLTEVPVPTR